MEDASHINMDAWYIIVGGVSAFAVDTQEILRRGSGFLRDCLCEVGEGAQASRLTDAMSKGSFHVIFFKTQRFSMLDKCILKIKIHPMTSSGFHGICRINFPCNTILHCNLWSAVCSLQSTVFSLLRGFKWLLITHDGLSERGTTRSLCGMGPVVSLELFVSRAYIVIYPLPVFCFTSTGESYTFL